MLKKHLNLNKKAFSLLLCIVSAFSLWVYVSYVENPEITRTIKHIAVKVVGEDELNSNGLAVKGISDDYISLTLNTKRSNYRHLSPDSVLATVDVSSLSAIGEHDLTVAISFPSSTSDVSISDKTVSVSLEIEKYITHDFEVIPLYSGTALSGYSVREMHLDSSSNVISVSGGESAVNKIDKVVTNPVDISLVKEDFTKSVSVKAVDENGDAVQKVKFDLDTPVSADFTVYRTELFPLEINISRDISSTHTTCETNAVKITGPVKEITAWIAQGKTIRTAPIDESLYRDVTEARIALPSLPDRFEYVGDDATEIMVKFEHIEDLQNEN